MTLLGIPPELRNHIYRYALVQDSGIQVSAQERLQPALLRTCRQTRKEASSIFYEENTFEVNTVDMKPQLPLQHWAETEVGAKNPKLITINILGVSKWCNLKDWLEQYHSCKIFGLSDAANTPVRIQCAARAFRIVDKMPGVPWAVVEAVLEEYKKTRRGPSSRMVHGLGAWA